MGVKLCALFRVSGSISCQLIRLYPSCFVNEIVAERLGQFFAT